MTIRIKIIALLVLFFTFSEVAFAKNPPSWITNRPISNTKYIGISQVALTEKEYQNVATSLALNDIAAQICVNISSESYLELKDDNGEASDFFEQKIKSSVATQLEGYKLVDTYQSSTHYHVYYELDKELYKSIMEIKRMDIVEDGLDMYEKGISAEKKGDFITASQLYSKGLELIEPYLTLKLTTTYNGKEIDIANELYNALTNVFSGLTLTVNPKQISATAFKPVNEPVSVSLTKGGFPISNISINAKFLTGSGTLSPSAKTDNRGAVSFYFQNITSREMLQTVEFSVNNSFLNYLPKQYRGVAKVENLPTAKITLSLTGSSVSTAYFVSETNDLPACEQQIRSLLTKDYFQFSQDEKSADVKIIYSTKYRKGGVVTGDLYNMNEYFCSMTIKVCDNKSGATIINYSISDLRVLSPEKNSPAQSIASCSRELLKKAKIELPREMKRINL